jgi:hypothetical protein
MSRSYFDKNGILQYTVRDENEKCVSKTCNLGTCRIVGDEKSGTDIIIIGNGEQCLSSAMACRAAWWRNANWTSWWGWSITAYGDNLTYLYSEIEAPEAYRCGAIDNCPTGGSQNCDDISKNSCGKPRIARCKTYGCVADYNSFNGNYNCDIINGKDREMRCCKAPSNFKCEKGGCDFDYEIVKKEYTIDYELVQPAYSCVVRATYPETSCSPHVEISDAGSCLETRTTCSTDPPAKCDKGHFWWNDLRCPPNDPPSPGYSEVTSSIISVDHLWELDDCDCGYNKDLGYHTCNSCYNCDEFKDCNYDFIGANGANWSWGGYIGDDCCANNFLSIWGWPLSPCPIDGDGSENPWWCDGTECSQKASGDELEDDIGPFISYRSCMQKCLQDETGNTNLCIPDSKSYIRGLCCDSNFIEQMQNNIKDGCYEEGPQYIKKTKEKLCESSSCSNDLILERSDDMCTYNAKYCPSHMVKKTYKSVTYQYIPPPPDKGYYRRCNSCDKASNDECEKDPLSKCPKNTGRIVLTNTRNHVPEKIIETKTIKLIMVFCKITTKDCVIDEIE